jgi:amidohydrolase
MNISNDDLRQIIAFRHQLHQHPELSGKEIETAKKIKEFLGIFQPDKIYENLGGAGLAAVYKGSAKGPTVLLRADTDALPITETNNFDYKSKNKGVAHKCGHDGHSAILSGVALALHQQRPARGRVVLLFQPAEETGQGARRVIDDPKFAELQPDYAFALHNLPGFAAGHVVIKNQHFAAASKGMIIRLTGKTSHAANPEHGISPAMAVADIIKGLTELSMEKKGFRDFKLITVIHTRLGEIAFGTTPGYAEVMATLRSFRNDDMQRLTEKALEIAEKAADQYHLHEKIEWREEFPATVNDPECVDIIRQTAAKNSLKIEDPDTPFRWSEDFGYFTSEYKGAMFGIGSGVKHPELHYPDYDFPDMIIPQAIAMFDGIIRNILG